MKFVGLVKTNYDQSYNRGFARVIKDILKIKFELEVLEIIEVLCLTKMKNGMKVSNFNAPITKLHALTVSSLTPEHNHYLCST